MAQNDQGKPQDDRNPGQNPDKSGQQQQQDERKRQPGQEPDDDSRQNR